MVCRHGVVAHDTVMCTYISCIHYMCIYNCAFFENSISVPCTRFLQVYQITQKIVDKVKIKERGDKLCTFLQASAIETLIRAASSSY